MEAPLLPTLTSAAAHADAVQVTFTLPGSALESALFRAGQRGEVFTGAPVQEALSGTSTIVSGLAPGEHYFGLAVRPAGAAGAYTPAGAILRCRVGPVIYVDARSTAAAPDGLTPETAYREVADGLIAGAVMGRHVLVREGTYGAAGLQLVAGVQVYGGFDAGFALGGRDPVARATVLQGSAGVPLLVVGDADPAAVIDGLVLDGLGVASVGIDAQDASFEVRATAVRGCFDRGLRARSDARSSSFRVRLTGCRFVANRTDGISIGGPFDVEIHGCNVDANGAEGLDVDDLVALEGDTANLVVEGSRFLGNGAEGLDCDLAGPLDPLPPPGGVFDVRIRGCRFELNGGDGVLLDQEFESLPLWRAHITVRECTARGNQRAGFHVDADAYGDLFLHRLSATANGTDGVWIASETAAGFATLGASLLLGNGGAGARASLGNKPLLLAHCVLAGNFGGGLVSEAVPSTAASCIAYLQDAAFPGAWTVGSSETRIPGTFLAAAREFHQVVDRTAATVVLAAPIVLEAGAALELADDRIVRTAAAGSTAAVTLAPPPDAARLPSVLAVFPAGTEVWEDLRLADGSPLAGTGMSHPGGPAVDPGIWGAPAPGFPGIGDELAAPAPLRVLAAGSGLHAHPASQPIALEFSAAIDAATLAGRVYTRTRGGGELPVTVSADGAIVQLVPPASGFGSEPFTIELHRGLRALGGSELAVPLVLPVNPVP